MRRLPLAIAVAAAPLAAQPAPSPPAWPTAGFVVTVGADTLAVERIRRDTAGVPTLAELRLLRPARVRLLQSVRAAADGAVGQSMLQAWPPGAADDAPFAQRVNAAWTGDTVHLTVTPGAGALAVGGAHGRVPFVNLSALSLELIARRARTLGATGSAGAGAAPVTVPLLLYEGGRRLEARVAAVGADSLVVTIGGVVLRAAATADGRLLGAEVPSQGVRFAVADQLPAAAHGGASARHAPPPGAPYTAEEVRVPGGAPGVALAGTLTRPTNVAGRVPVVVTISGSGPQDRDGAILGLAGYAPFRELADTLGRRGVAVLRLDDRGVGASVGAPAGATTADLAGDVRAVVAWLRVRPDVDPARVFLAGHSEGGLIAPLVAADDARLAGIVLLAAPSRPGREVSLAQRRWAVDRALAGRPQAVRDSVVRVRQAEADTLVVRDPWVAHWWTYDPRPTAARVRVPVLVVQGATDRQVPAGQATELGAVLRRAGNRDVTVRVVPAANHLLVHDPAGAGDLAGYRALAARTVRPDVLATIAEWVTTRARAQSLR